MTFYENLRLAWSCVKSNKMRSILTMLGIIIGISAVITISTLGSSLRQTISGTYSDMMTTNQLAFMWVNTSEDDTAEPPVKFDLENCYEFKEAFTGQISAVMLDHYLGMGTYYNDEEEKEVNILGYSEGYCESNKYELVMGRDVEFQDSFENRKVCVVSENFVKYGLDGVSNPIGQKVEFEMPDGTIVSAYIIGVYKMDNKQSSLTGQAKVAEKDKITDVIIPVTYAWDIDEVPDNKRFTEPLYISGEPGIDGTALKENVTKYFESKREAGSTYFLYIQSLKNSLRP